MQRQRQKVGPFTRIDPADPEKLSTLDLCIVSKDLLNYVDSFLIDKKRNFTPFRSINKKKVTSSDHFSLLVTFKDIPCAKDKEVGLKGFVSWNTNREGGWLKYKELTANNNLLNIVIS